MRDAFLIWVTFQLVVTGWAMVKVSNEMVDGKYSCESEKVPAFVGAILPIATFAPNITEDYCKVKEGAEV